MSSNPISPGGNLLASSNEAAASRRLLQGYGYTLEQFVVEVPRIVMTAGLILMSASMDMWNRSSSLPEPFRGRARAIAEEDMELGARAVVLCIQAHTPR